MQSRQGKGRAGLGAGWGRVGQEADLGGPRGQDLVQPSAAGVGWGSSGTGTPPFPS